MKKVFSYVLVVFLLVAFLPLLGTPSARAEQVIYYPGQTVLGVQNAVFGSRLNINRHYDWGRRKAWTSTRGAMMDDMTSFIVATRSNSDGSVMRFAPSDQGYPEYWYHTTDLDANSQYMGGAHVRNGATPGVASDVTFSVSSKTMAHFVPTKSLDDPNLKMSIAPFFYEEVTVSNATGGWQSGELLVSVDYAVDYRQTGDTKTIYYRTGADQGGVRALAICDSSASWGIGTRIFGDFAASGRLVNSNQADGVYNAAGFALPFNLAPGQSVKKTLVYAGYYGGNIMVDQRNGRGMKFYYTKFFSGVEDVINYAFSNYGDVVQKANNFSASLRTGNSALDFATSQGVHSYMANTWLLYDPANGEPRYYVSEGQCQYLSTIDVGYDTAFFETEFMPWALKIQLEEWSQYVSYDEYGAFLEHDMGFGCTIQAKQNYPHLMGIEESTNYMLMLYLYWKRTGDTAFVKTKIPLVQQLISSLQKRDTNGNGIVDVNAFHTTADVDMGASAIGDGCENIYIAIKEFSSFLAADFMYKATGTGGGETCRQWANKICQSLKGAYNRFGYLPVSLSAAKPYWGDQTIINFEGVLYFLLTGTQDVLIDDLLGNTCPSHLWALINCNSDYGYRISSSGNDIWLSKSFNAKVISDFLIIKGYYAYDDDLIGKTKALLERCDLGFADGWSAASGGLTTASLSLYPRGLALTVYPIMIPDMVTMEYQRWLQRNPDSNGYQCWFSAVNSGALSINQVTQGFRHSNEYAERYVEEVFRQIFGHPQDAYGHQCYVNAITSWQMNDADVYFEFKYSEIVTRAYRELLFREPDEGGYAVYMNAMKGGMTEQQVRESIMASEEYRQKHP